MIHSKLSLALLAAIAVPAACQTTDDSIFAAPRYGVALDSLAFGDVDAVHGLNVASLIGKGASPSVKVPSRTEFAFMRGWSGELDLANKVGSAPSTVSIDLNPVGGTLPPALEVQLGNAKFNEWCLLVENGVMAAESSRFTYSTRAVTTLPAPIVGRGTLSESGRRSSPR